MNLRLLGLSAVSAVALSFGTAAQAAPVVTGVGGLHVDQHSLQQVRYDDEYRPWWRRHHRWAEDGYGWRRHWWWRHRIAREREYERDRWRNRESWRERGDYRWR